MTDIPLSDRQLAVDPEGLWSHWEMANVKHEAQIVAPHRCFRTGAIINLTPGPSVTLLSHRLKRHFWRNCPLAAPPCSLSIQFLLWLSTPCSPWPPPLPSHGLKWLSVSRLQNYLPPSAGNWVSWGRPRAEWFTLLAFIRFHLISLQFHKVCVWVC